MRIKGYVGWMGSVFLFFLQKFLVPAVGPSRGAAGLGVGLRCWVWWSVCGEVEGVACQMHPFWVWITWFVLGADPFGWLLSFHGLLSGQSAMSGAWPWIGLGGPGEGLGASLIIFLMVCNYIKLQNCR